MKNGFFLKTAWGNIKKNYRFFVPRILSEAGLLGVFYIVFTLKTDERLNELEGGDYIGAFMSIGVAVIMLLSVILMLYTNSFLMKQRRSEFGLYNVLGMEKRHVGRVMLFESLISGAFSVILGLATGALFYKLCSLLICKLLRADIILGFYFLRPSSLILSALFFVAVDVVTYIVNLITVAKMKPVELLSSKSTGEREPRIKWVLLLLGVLCLGGGYYISLTTEKPVETILLFFLAVILVIIGTYFLFTAGTIFVLKMLKKNRKYYYSPKHMPAVSGLLYRMKQNAVGLASICILATGVLVMISTTVSLYAGMDETLETNYPQDLYLSTRFYTQIEDSEEWELKTVSSEEAEKALREVCDRNGIEIKDIKPQVFLEVSYKYENGRLITENSGINMAANLTGLSTMTYITEDMYESQTGKRLNLEEDEVAICALSASENYKETGINISGRDFRIKEILTYFPIRATMISSSNCYGVVVADDGIMDMIYKEQTEAYGANASEYNTRLAVTFEDESKVADIYCKFDGELEDAMNEFIFEDERDLSSWGGFDAKWDARISLVGMFGVFLFLGIILGLVCMFATVLIIYYKQISEGYEDRQRFQIMQKIGMSNKEVKKTVNSQVLLVFFLPLIAAAVHMVFAFPMLEKLLKILMLPRTSLFVICSLITFTLFSVIYVIIYSVTSKTYYKIVH